MPPRLNILSAVWGPLDVTAQVQDAVAPDQTYTTDGDSDPVGVEDPWPGVRKTFAILYRYGDGPFNLFLTMDGSGVQSINHSTPKSPYLFPDYRAFDNRTNVIAIIWGDMMNCSGPVPNAVYDKLYTSGVIECSNNAFTFDGLPNWLKTAVVFYRYGVCGRPYAVFAKEGSQLYLNR